MNEDCSIFFPNLLCDEEKATIVSQTLTAHELSSWRATARALQFPVTELSTAEGSIAKQTPLRCCSVDAVTMLTQPGASIGFIAF